MEQDPSNCVRLRLWFLVASVFNLRAISPCPRLFVLVLVLSYVVLGIKPMPSSMLGHTEPHPQPYARAFDYKLNFSRPRILLAPFPPVSVLANFVLWGFFPLHLSCQNFDHQVSFMMLRCYFPLSFVPASHAGTLVSPELPLSS